MLPTVAVIAAMALFPLAWTLWESLHRHDLRFPEAGRSFVGLANYAEAFGDPRALGALARTAGFAAATVSLEMLLGLGLALALDALGRGRGLARAAALVPWALPTVVAALVWRFLFDGPGAAANLLPGPPRAWLADPWLAWVPVVLADVWKTTPFVALLLLAGLQGVDPSLREAARVDGAGPVQELWHVVLPRLRPALGVALVFRLLDALRVFDLIYVLTAGGPGTATEPIALTSFAALLQSLRFGYGSALAMLVFLASFLVALAGIRLLGREDAA